MTVPKIILKYSHPFLSESLHEELEWKLKCLVARNEQGTSVYCPICKGSFKSFRPYNKRQNVECPRCGAFERHRLLAIYLQQKTDLLSAKHRVLHMAPEYSLRRFLRQHENIDYLSGDLQSHRADKHFDITAIPFEDRSYSVILCNHVLEHIPDDRKAMRELFRILEPGGWAVLMVPLRLDRLTDEEPNETNPEVLLRRFGQKDHVRIYGKDYFERLGSVGFEVEKNEFASSFSQEEANRLGILPNEIIVIARKPAP